MPYSLTTRRACSPRRSRPVHVLGGLPRMKPARRIGLSLAFILLAAALAGRAAASSDRYDRAVHALSSHQLQARRSTPAHIVAFFGRHRWLLAPRHATCWSHVPWSRSCDRARLAHRAARLEACRDRPAARRPRRDRGPRSSRERLAGAPPAMGMPEPARGIADLGQSERPLRDAANACRLGIRDELPRLRRPADRSGAGRRASLRGEPLCAIVPRGPMDPMGRRVGVPRIRLKPRRVAPRPAENAPPLSEGRTDSSPSSVRSPVRERSGRSPASGCRSG